MMKSVNETFFLMYFYYWQMSFFLKRMKIALRIFNKSIFYPLTVKRMRNLIRFKIQSFQNREIRKIQF